MTARRILATASIGAVAALGLSAPAHAASKSTNAKQWAGDVCSAFLTFGDDVESTLSGLKSSDSVESASESAKQGVQQAADDLQSSLDALGKPPTPNAAQAQSAIAGLGNQLAKDADAVEQALTPSPSTPSEIASAFASIGSTAQKAVSQVKATASTLEGLQGGGLEKAFQGAPSCQQLRKDL